MLHHYSPSLTTHTGGGPGPSGGSRPCGGPRPSGRLWDSLGVSSGIWSTYDLIFRAKYISSEKNFMIYIKSQAFEDLNSSAIGREDTVKEKDINLLEDFKKHSTINFCCFYSAPKLLSSTVEDRIGLRRR